MTCMLIESFSGFTFDKMLIYINKKSKELRGVKERT